MKNKYIILLFVSFFMVSCNDFLDVKPTGLVIPNSSEDFRNFLTAAYAINKNKDFFAYRADELFIPSEGSKNADKYEDIYTWNDKSPSISTSKFAYSQYYKVIFYANHVINSADKIDGKAKEINQIVGEAHALRALQYFELVNMYAPKYNKSTAKRDKGVPIITKYNPEQKFTISSVDEIYTLILSDIDKASKLMTVKKQDKKEYRYRFSKVALLSLKSRVMLYQAEWRKAIDTASEALKIQSELQNLNINTVQFPCEYSAVESILALDKTSSSDIVEGTFVSDQLLSKYDKVNDLRVKLYFNVKNGRYNVKKGYDIKYKCTFRTSEFYLTKAEAYVKLNELNKAKEIMLLFAKHRYKSSFISTYQKNLNSMIKNQLYEEIMKERAREFFVEAHRWFDLKRTNQPKIVKKYNGKEYVLEKNDKRYVLTFPKDATINNDELQKK